MVQQLTNSTSICEDMGSIPGLPQWVKDWRCHKLWSRPKMPLGSRTAVAVVYAGGYSSDWTPSLGTSICCGCSPKKTERKKKIALSCEISFLDILCTFVCPQCICKPQATDSAVSGWPILLHRAEVYPMAGMDVHSESPAHERVHSKCRKDRTWLRLKLSLNY